MFRNLIVLLLCIVSSVSYANQIERTYYDNGQLEFEGFSKESGNDIEANYKTYFETGELASHVVTVPGKLGFQNYTIEAYFAPGRLNTRHTIADGKLVGDFIFTTYFDDGTESVQLSIKGSSNSANLKLKEYYENKQLRMTSKVKFVNSSKSHDYFMYDADDFQDAYFSEDITATIVQYHRNGALGFTGKLVNGVEDGEIMYFTDKDQIEKKYRMKDGKKVGRGIENIYYSNGQIKSKTVTVDGKAVGPYESFYENGLLEEKGTYTLKKHYGPFANNTLQSFKGGVWKKYFYHNNGKLEQELTYLNEELHGPYKKNDSAGNIIESGQYEANEKHGVWQQGNIEVGKLVYVKYRGGEIVSMSKELYHRLYVENRCDRTVDVLIHYLDDNARYQFKGWTTVGVNEEKLVARSKFSTFYVYAETRDEETAWKGDYVHTFKNNKYSFFDVVIDSDFFTKNTVPLACD